MHGFVSFCFSCIPPPLGRACIDTFPLFFSRFQRYGTIASGDHRPCLCSRNCWVLRPCISFIMGRVGSWFHLLLWSAARVWSVAMGHPYFLCLNPCFMPLSFFNATFSNLRMVRGFKRGLFKCMAILVVWVHTIPLFQTFERSVVLHPTPGPSYPSESERVISTTVLSGCRSGRGTFFGLLLRFFSFCSGFYPHPCWLLLPSLGHPPSCSAASSCRAPPVLCMCCTFQCSKLVGRFPPSPLVGPTGLGSPSG